MGNSLFRKMPYNTNQYPKQATPNAPYPYDTTGGYSPSTIPTPYTPTPIPTSTGAPDYEHESGAPVQLSASYMQGFLRRQIGKYVKIDFLIGTNMLIDREGTLLNVGIDYVTLREPETDDELLCDLYSIKFVRIFH